MDLHAALLEGLRAAAAGAFTPRFYQVRVSRRRVKRYRRPGMGRRSRRPRRARCRHFTTLADAVSRNLPADFIETDERSGRRSASDSMRTCESRVERPTDLLQSLFATSQPTSLHNRDPFDLDMLATERQHDAFADRAFHPRSATHVHSSPSALTSVSPSGPIL